MRKAFALVIVVAALYAWMRAAAARRLRAME
jgi:hypothetical protein